MMPSSLSAILFITIICFIQTVVGVHGNDEHPFSFFTNIGQDFFDDNDGIEASGVDIAPDGSHLVIVTDEGEIIFLNLLDYDSGHCMVDLHDDVEYGTDFEGVAIDPTEWSSNNMNAYVVHEGGDDDEPYLYKINYEYDPHTGSCSVSVLESQSLYSAIPCLETSNGIESLGLKSPSTETEPAIFFVGIQDTGKVYEVTSEGMSNGPYCYDGSGVGGDDISATAYNREHGHIWSYMESDDNISVVDTAKNCPVAIYEMTSSSLDEEGLAIDFENGLMYLVVDGQGDGSVVSAHNFSYPEGIDECLLDTRDSPESCSNFSVCGSDARKSLRRGKLFD